MKPKKVLELEDSTTFTITKVDRHTLEIEIKTISDVCTFLITNEEAIILVSSLKEIIQEVDKPFNNFMFKFAPSVNYKGAWDMKSKIDTLKQPKKRLTLKDMWGML